MTKRKRQVGVRIRDDAEYRVWRGMIERCSNPNHDRFAYYGGRGIAVCERWRDSYSDFVSDVGPRPSLKHSIDRIDNSKNYEPGNVRWATYREQSRNRRNNVVLFHNGQHVILTDAAKKAGLSIEAIKYRLRNGWDVDRAIKEPPANQNRRQR